LKRRVDLGDCAVAYRESQGTGPAVVLIHGNSASTATWRAFFGGPLAGRYRLVAMDLPGCGDSGRLASYSLRGLADFIVRFAAATRCDDGLFVGHSLGGHLVLEAASRLPNARGFVLNGAAPIGKPPRLDEAFLPSPSLAAGMKSDLTAEEIEGWTRAMAQPDTAVPPALDADIRRTDGRFRAGLAESIGALDYTDEVEIVARLGKPVAIVHGSDEALVNKSYLDRLSIPSLWRGAIQVIEGAGHLAPLQRPEPFQGLLGEFAADVLGR